MFYQIFRIFLIMSLATIQGCAQIGAYRTEYSSVCQYEHTGDCANKAVQEYAIGQDEEYRLSFVEFDDQGQVNDRKQMHSVLNNFRSISGTQDIILVVYVHGWHHNAEVEDNNIDKFRGLLRKLAKVEYQNKSNRKVLGVYVGWRGDSFNVPYLKHVTFWDRKNTAHNIGQQGITELLLRLEEIVNVKAGVDESIPKPINNKLITIGHSFGGAALYTALQQIFVDRFIDSRKGKTSTSLEVNGFGDLVVLMNPAFEALRHATLFDISQEYCRRYSSNQLPKLAILTSKADYATRVAFPMGRFFTTLFEDHNTLIRHNCKGTGSSNQVTLELDEGAADKYTVGHFESFLTHRLEPLSNIEKRTSKFSFKRMQKKWLGLKQNQSFDFESTRLIHIKDNTVAHNPFMNIQVDESLISGHNDIWQDEIVSFVRDLIKITTE